MDRGASAAVITELGKSANQPIHLFTMYFDSGTVYATDAHRNIVWGANTYLAVGTLLEFSGVEESSDLQVASAVVTLSGVDQALISIVLADNVVDRRLTLHKGFLNGSDGVIVDPLPLFDGRMSSELIAEDPITGKCTVAITASNQWVDFERRPGRHTNHEEEQIWFPGDNGFEFVSQLNKEIIWGRAK